MEEDLVAVRVRPIETPDAAAWTRMRERLWPSAPGEHAGEVRAFFEGRLVEPAAVFVAVNDADEPIGFVELSIRSHAEGCEPGRIAYVEGWFVAEGQRRQGIGRALIVQAEEWGRQGGCSALASDADLENAASQSAHERLGFRETGRIACFAKPLRSEPLPRGAGSA
jgi:aminoglycoside 6'-N-acetyltransferase I